MMRLVRGSGIGHGSRLRADNHVFNRAFVKILI
jgi:hypothetical protein